MAEPGPHVDVDVGGLLLRIRAVDEAGHEKDHAVEHEQAADDAADVEQSRRGGPVVFARSMSFSRQAGQRKGM